MVEDSDKIIRVGKFCALQMPVWRIKLTILGHRQVGQPYGNGLQLRWRHSVNDISEGSDWSKILILIGMDQK